MKPHADEFDFEPDELERLIEQGERSIAEEGTVDAAEFFAELRARPRKSRPVTDDQA